MSVQNIVPAWCSVIKAADSRKWFAVAWRDTDDHRLRGMGSLVGGNWVTRVVFDEDVDRVAAEVEAAVVDADRQVGLSKAG